MWHRRLCHCQSPHSRAKGFDRSGDAQALAGEKTSTDMWVDEIIRPDPDGWGFYLKNQVNTVGYSSICTPGTVKAFGKMLDEWGTYSFAQAAEPAIKAAEAGWQLQERQANMWKRPPPLPGMGDRT